MEHRPPGSLPPTTLILGGARAGKSRHAEEMIVASGAISALYLATAQAGDVEMATRILAHKARRDGLWHTLEEPLQLAEALSANAQGGRPILIDCLTLWLSNLMLGGEDVDERTDHLIDALGGLPCPVVMVANEVGLGIVPDNALGRAFRDAAGRLNQRIASASHRVILVAAGLPLLLKDRASA